MNTIKIKGVEYQVEFNWNAISDACAKLNCKPLRLISSVTELDERELPIMLHCGIVEGCRIADVECISFEDFSKAARISTIGELMTIFSQQNSMEVDEDDEKK